MYTHILHPYVFLLQCCHLLNCSSISPQYQTSQCFLATESVKILLRNSSGNKDRGEGHMRIRPQPSFCATRKPCRSSAMHVATSGEIAVAVSRLARNYQRLVWQSQTLARVGRVWCQAYILICSLRIISIHE